MAPANLVSKLLRFLGVQAQVVLVHEGDQVTPGQSPDACPVVPGAGTRIAEGLDAEIDLIVTGHSHQAYVCKTVDPKGNDRYVTQGSSFGRVLTQIDFKIDRKTHDVIRSSVTVDNHVVTRTVTPGSDDRRARPDVEGPRGRGRQRSRSARSRPTCRTRPRRPARWPLGNLIADAQLEATADRRRRARSPSMNPGGIRAGLTFASSPAGEGDGVVTYGEAFAVQPFNNLMQVVTLTGAAARR